MDIEFKPLKLSHEKSMSYSKKYITVLTTLTSRFSFAEISFVPSLWTSMVGMDPLDKKRLVPSFSNVSNVAANRLEKQSGSKWAEHK